MCATAQLQRSIDAVEEILLFLLWFEYDITQQPKQARVLKLTAKTSLN